ncbi:MAG: sugar ABC transporter permease [Clostridia bacterium]|nr:sugar ABC transporter permease [Clostridia bacterium]
MNYTTVRIGKRSEHIKHTLRGVLSDWRLYILIAPAVVYIFLFNYMPMYGVQIAFKDFRPSKGIWGSAWVGFDYFQQFINNPLFGKLIWNTMRISLYSLATFPLPIVLALMINELDNQKFKKTVQMVTYAPHFLSTVVVCSMVTLFCSKENGLFNNLIEMVGGERVSILEKASLFTPVYVWSGVWQSIGWNSILYIAALSGVSPELVEAARIDGANRFQIITHVNIPSIMPTVVITLIMSCGSVLSVGFEKVYLLQNKLNMDASNVIATYVYELGLISAQYSASAAIGLFNTIVNITMLLIVNAIARRVSEISLF